MPKKANLVKAIFNRFSNDFQTSLKRFSTYSQSFFNCFSTVFQVISHLDCHVKTFKIRDIYSHFMPEGFENFRISTSCVILAGQAWSQKTELMSCALLHLVFNDVLHLKASIAFKIEYEDENTKKICMNYA